MLFLHSSGLGWDEAVRVWDATTGQESWTLRGHTDQVNCVAVMPLLVEAGFLAGPRRAVLRA